MSCQASPGDGPPGARMREDMNELLHWRLHEFRTKVMRCHELNNDDYGV